MEGRPRLRYRKDTSPTAHSVRQSADTTKLNFSFGAGTKSLLRNRSRDRVAAVAAGAHMKLIGPCAMILSGRCFAPSGPRPTCARSNLLASPIVTRLLAGDHDDAAYGVMGPTGVAGLLLESNCRA